MSKCGFCDKLSSWEVSEESPIGSAFKVNFIRCNLCKVPIGVVPYYDTHSKLEEIEAGIKKLKESTEYSLQIINENLRRLSLK